MCVPTRKESHVAVPAAARTLDAERAHRLVGPGLVDSTVPCSSSVTYDFRPRASMRSIEVFDRTAP